MKQGPDFRPHLSSTPAPYSSSKALSRALTQEAQVRQKCWITFLEVVKNILVDKVGCYAGVISQAQCWGESQQPQYPPKVGRAHCRIFIRRNSSMAPDTLSVDLELLMRSAQNSPLSPPLPLVTLDQVLCPAIRYGSLSYSGTHERKMHHFCRSMEETPASWVLSPPLCLHQRG